MNKHTRDRDMDRMDDRDIDKRDVDTNPDPITGEHGSHPVSTGLGAAGGAATGAAIGAVGGPIGAAIGVVAGGVLGGLAGKGVAERVNPTIENEYWSAEYPKRHYYDANMNYERYRPAYQYGWESYGRYAGTNRSYDELEPELEAGWRDYDHDPDLTWDRARHGARDAWHRIERAIPGDADKDGR